jgi:hypothetical protein
MNKLFYFKRSYRTSQKANLIILNELNEIIIGFGSLLGALTAEKTNKILILDLSLNNLLKIAYILNTYIPYSNNYLEVPH